MRAYRRPARVSSMRSVPRRRTTLKRQAFGNFASAMQQRDSTNIVISKQEDVNIYVPAGCSEATLVRNANAILTSTDYFQNYMGMYDQYKINAVRASCEMTYISNVLLNSATFPSICTSWDRNGIKVTTVDARAAGAGVANLKYWLPTYSNVASYSSANEKTLYYGSRWGVIRQLDAASMMEKSMYMPTTNTREVLSTGNLYSAWNPMLLIGIKAPTVVTGDQYCTITIHWQFDVTLRGFRKVVIDNINRFIPTAGFIGYAKDNKGLAVLHPNGNPNDANFGQFSVVGGVAAGADPTINPSYNQPAGSGNGLVVPNTGLPADNQAL